MSARRLFASCLTLGLALGGLMAAAGPASGQTLDEVLARYAQARGGLERWRAVDALELRGAFTSFSKDAPFTILHKRPGLYRFESDSLAGRFIQGRDREGSWLLFPAYGIETPKRATSPLAELITREAELEPPLLGAREKGHTVELLGRGEVDGQETCAVKVTLQGGKVETWHLDPRTWLEVAIESTTYDYTQTSRELTRWTYFSDFRPVEGLVLPFRVEREHQARYEVFVLDRVLVDPLIEEARFRMPQPKPQG